MSNSWLLAVALSVALVSSALAECVTYGNCGTEPDTGKPLPCAVKRDPVPLESQLLEKACPALLDPSGKSASVCCDAKQAQNMVSEFETLRNLIGNEDKCFPNFQNLVCQAYCSPKQSEFVAINKTSTEKSGNSSATELVYAVHQSFAEGVYAACKGISTKVLGLNLMRFMCGKQGLFVKCSAQKFLDFVGSVSSEGGYSPVKMKFQLTKSRYTVGDRKLEPYNPNLI